MFKNKIYKIDKDGNRHRIFFCNGLNIRFKGKNSIIELETPLPKFKNCIIKVGSNCKIRICSSNYHIKNLKILATADNVKCFIGRNFSLTDGCSILLHKENNLFVNIGEDCMFGSNILLRTSDVHSIVDNDTKEVLNYGGSIDIGNHCWLASNVTIMKKVNIATNCVIGANSLITKDCSDCNTVYAGIPAKKVKNNINWCRECPANI